MTIAHESDVVSVDRLTRDSVTHSVLSNVCEPLVGFDRDTAVVPLLAVRWNAVSDEV